MTRILKTRSYVFLHFFVIPLKKNTHSVRSLSGKNHFFFLFGVCMCVWVGRVKHHAFTRIRRPSTSQHPRPARNRLLCVPQGASEAADLCLVSGDHESHVFAFPSDARQRPVSKASAHYTGHAGAAKGWSKDTPLPHT